MKSGDSYKQIQLREFICSSAKNYKGVKKTTQNDFVYGELSRTSYITKRYFSILKYWFKILLAEENKYIKIVYKRMLRDLERLPNKVNWAFLVKHLLMSFGFYNNGWVRGWINMVGS